VKAFGFPLGIANLSACEHGLIVSSWHEPKGQLSTAFLKDLADPASGAPADQGVAALDVGIHVRTARYCLVNQRALSG
jgi:hypothetical protein